MKRIYKEALALTVAMLAVALASCGGLHSLSPSPGNNNVNAMNPEAMPQVLENGVISSHWKRFTPKTLSGIYRGIVVGSDKNIWFADNNGSALVRLSMTGGFHEFPLRFTEGGITYSFAPLFVAVGSDGKFYLNGTNDPVTGKGLIGVLTTAGKFVVYHTPSGDTLSGNGLGLGSDGNVWFAETSHIAKITTAGSITEFKYPSGENSNTASNAIAGPDGNVWFTEYFKKKVAKINPSTHAIMEFDVSSDCSGASGLAVGSDGKLYFACGFSFLGKITTSGALTAIPDSNGMLALPDDIVQGPSHHIWLASNNNGILGEYNESTGSLTFHTVPATLTSVGEWQGLAYGPDGNIWMPENCCNHIDVYVFVDLTVKPTSLTFTGIGQAQGLTATYSGSGALTAVSASTLIATVSPGATKNTFVVTSRGVGKTTITVQDAIGNLFHITVTVE